MAAAVAIALTLAAPPALAQDSYIDRLSLLLEEASRHLDDAAAAISDCNDDVLACFQQPAAYANRIEAAAAGLAGVLENLTLLEAPPQYASSHATLQEGFRDVSDGLNLYAEGLRERDLAKLDSGGTLVRNGKQDIQAASTAILSQPLVGIDTMVILFAAVAATTVAIAVLAVVLIRTASQDRRQRVEKEVATCPTCGTTMDRWWTYSVKQVRGWREDHLASHATEETRLPEA